MQRESSSVGAIVQQPLDSLLVSISTFFTDVRAAGKDIVYLARQRNKRRPLYFQQFPLSLLDGCSLKNVMALQLN